MLARIRQDAREQLVSRTLDTGGDLTHCVHDIFGNVIAETNGAGPGGTTREYIWLPETEIAPTMGSRAQIDRPLGVVSGVGGRARSCGWSMSTT